MNFNQERLVPYARNLRRYMLDGDDYIKKAARNTLQYATDLLCTGERWINSHYALDKNRAEIDPESYRAEYYSLVGAIKHAEARTNVVWAPPIKIEPYNPTVMLRAKLYYTMYNAVRKAVIEYITDSTIAFVDYDVVVNKYGKQGYLYSILEERDYIEGFNNDDGRTYKHIISVLHEASVLIGLETELRYGNFRGIG